MIRAIIVDDEWAAIGNLGDILKESGQVEIAGEYTNPLEALEIMKKNPVDIAFLDIEMPGIHGMDLANQMLDILPKLQIVFVTAYNEYAIDAFKLNATDYLMKPVSLERLRITLNRVSDHKLRSKGSSKLRVSCFGKFRVDNDEGLPVKWRTNKTEELFAYLIDKNGKEVGKEIITDVIWSGFDRKRSLTNLNTTLYNLRKTLKELGYPELLSCSNGMYKLDMSQIDSDIQSFYSCITQAANAIDQRLIVQCEQVIERCGDRYMALNYYDWAEANSSLIEEEYTSLMLRVAAYYKSNQMTDKAAKLLKKGLLRDALHPKLNRELMALYMQSNNDYAAMKLYEEYRRKLDHELGITPDQEMMKLRERLSLMN